MNALTSRFGRQVAFALLLILLPTACAHPPPLPFSCANFAETFWTEFNFSADSPADVAATAPRLWGIDEDKVRVDEELWGTVSRVAWLDRKIYGSVGGYSSWFREGVLIKFEVAWFFPTPTLSQAIDCLGDPEHYIAFVTLVPDSALFNLDLVYPQKGIVVHYSDLYTTDQIHPYLRLFNMSVVAPGTTEEVVDEAFSIGIHDSQLYGYSACLRKSWPGSFEAIEVASSDEFLQCLPESLFSSTIHSEKLSEKRLRSSGLTLWVLPS